MVKGLYGGECVELHHVFITDRGGTNRVAELVDLSEVHWTRLRDDVSEANIAIRGAACSAQADILRNIEPNRSEMVIYRGEDRVWEGPVNRVGWHSDWVEVNARDIFEYLLARPLSRTWDNRAPNQVTVTQRIANVVNYELTNPFTYRDDDGDPVTLPGWEQLVPPANVQPHFVAHAFPNEARTAALTTQFQMTVGEHIDNYARTGGIDYTVVGRALHVWDVSRFLGQTRTLTEADFYGEIIVSAYGADYASVAFTVAQDGRYGGAGGKFSSWRFLEKTGPAGTQLVLPPSGSTPREPSIADSGIVAWHGYRYWMAYRPTASQQMRVVASRPGSGSTWEDIGGANVDSDPTAGVTVTTGTWPTVAFRGSNRDHLWLFFIGANGHLYRTRSEDGKDWTSHIDLYTPAGTITMASPSLFYDEATNRWTCWFVNTQTNRLNWMTSTTSALDGSGQWGAVNVATIATNPNVGSVTMRRIGTVWVGMITTTGGDVYLIQAQRSTVVTIGFQITAAPIIPKVAAGKHDTLGRATFLQHDDAGGNLEAWYMGALATVPHVFRTAVTGPGSLVGTGDPSLDYYGPWSKIFTAYDESDTRDPSQADLNSQAKRNLSGRQPVPVEVRVPDNSGIRLSPGLTIQDLVPGTHMPLLATLNSRQVAQMQKLHHLSVTETAEGENIQVTLLPATKEDSDTEEEDEGD